MSYNNNSLYPPKDGLKQPLNAFGINIIYTFELSILPSPFDKYYKIELFWNPNETETWNNTATTCNGNFALPQHLRLASHYLTYPINVLPKSKNCKKGMWRNNNWKCNSHGYIKREKRREKWSNILEMGRDVFVEP